MKNIKKVEVRVPLNNANARSRILLDGQPDLEGKLMPLDHQAAFTFGTEQVEISSGLYERRGNVARVEEGYVFRHDTYFRR